MTSREINRAFTDALPYDREFDYCEAQFEWACFVDNLNRDGIVPDWQVVRITFPYKYGRSIVKHRSESRRGYVIQYVRRRYVR